jgi:hypothetical protein
MISGVRLDSVAVSDANGARGRDLPVDHDVLGRLFRLLKCYWPSFAMQMGCLG